MRMRSVTSVIILTAAAGLGAAAQIEPPIEAFAPVSPPEAAIAILPPGGLGTATALEAAASCHPTQRRAAIVALRWQAAAGEGLQAQRVDISKFRRGFEIDRYETTGKLPAVTSAVSVEAPEPRIRYYWRVLTQSPNGWVTSQQARFEVPICPWDEPSPGGAAGTALDAGSDTDVPPSPAPALLRGGKNREYTSSDSRPAP